MISSTTLHQRQEFSLTVLLMLEVVTTFAVSPFIDTNHGRYRWLLDFFIATMALVSIFVVANGRWRWVTIFSFAACLIGLVYGQSMSPQETLKSEVVSIMSGVFFTLNICWIVARKVFNDGPVTLHRIRGALVIYLNVVLLFALLDTLLATFFPSAFANVPQDPRERIGAMIYFSLATITTVGYGDIVPVHALARSISTLEAVVGQFYIAIMIATLVGRHISYRRDIGT